jgi:uncharacterized protein YecE (DUF72 family)
MRQGRVSGSERDVYCYFNNDQAGYAVENARVLLAVSEGSDASRDASGGD